jgi:putative ABC transport system permease protein
MISAGETLRLAARALRRNKLRSFLTTLGIIIGVGAVIFIQSIGEGAKSRVRAQIESAGTNIVMLFSGSSSGPGGRGGLDRSPPSPGRPARHPDRAAVGGGRGAADQRQQPVISETSTWNTQITGTTPDYFSIRNWPVASGAAVHRFGPGQCCEEMR